MYLHATARGTRPRVRRKYDEDFRVTPQYREGLPDMMAAVDAIEGSPAVIQQVGIADFRLPLRFRAKRRGTVHTLETSVSGTVSLAATLKGINMSRIMRVFYEHQQAVFTLERLERILQQYRRRVDSLSARIKLTFSYPILQRALRSGLEGYQYYRVSLEGAMDARGGFRRFMEFDFVYSSACPCSAELSEHARDVRDAYAIPHSQRSKARVRIEVVPGSKIAIEDLHAHCLRALRTETQVMVKREDEQAFAEMNGTYIKFVEDAARLLYRELSGDARIHDFQVMCAHFESLHSHDAVSVIAKGVPGGFAADAMDFAALR